MNIVAYVYCSPSFHPYPLGTKVAMFVLHLIPAHQSNDYQKVSITAEK